MTEQGSPLTDDQMRRLILGAKKARPEASRDDLENILDWAFRVRVQQAMLELALSGKAGLFWIEPPDEVGLKLLDPPPS